MNLFNIVIYGTLGVLGIFLSYLFITFIIFKFKKGNRPPTSQVQSGHFRNNNWVITSAIVSAQRELLDKELEKRFKKQSQSERFSILNDKRRYRRSHF